MIRDDEVMDEDNMDAAATWFDDDSDLPCDTIIAHVVHDHPVEGVEARDGHLASKAAVETVNYDGEKPEWAAEVTAIPEQGSSRGPGKRKVTANKLYKGDQFWHH
jgi:hypothetical protein